MSSHATSAASTAPTFLQSFDQTLPLLKPSPGPQYKSVKPSSQTTARAVPPKVLLCCPAKRLEAIADSTLQQDTKLKHRLTTKGIIANVPEFALENEADVVEASALYILAPIYETLSELYPGKWIRFAEHVSAKTSNEEGDKERVRYDLAFETPAQNGAKGKTIAVIEFKKRNMIDYDDFSAALLSTEATEEEIQDLKDNTREQDMETQLQRNAESYSKQVCKYAAQTKCPHVALFNWDNLLFYHFNCIGEGEGDAGDQANLIWVNETGTGGEFMKKCYIRKTLLGWLLKAFEDAGIERR